MKFINNNKKIRFIVGLLSFLAVTSCTFDEQIDPNRPSLNDVLSNASVSQLNNLVSAVESTMRNSLAIQTTASGTLARELYLFDADPRNTSDLLGKGPNSSQLDNDSFYSTAAFNSRYICIKNANVLMDALKNTNSVNEQEKSGYRGFAKTIIAYELIQVLKSYNRARIDVSDPDNLGPFLEFDQAIIEVIKILDDAVVDLNNAGTQFKLMLSSGFDGFNTPQTFITFNKGIRAVATLYAGQSSESLDSLNDSFFDLNGDLNVGPKHVYSLNPGDFTNGLFKVPQQSGDQIIVHDSWINDAEAGDTRVTTKTALRPVPAQSSDDLNGANEIALYASNISPIDMIRNEELILVYAEASILANNLADAVTALDVIRNAAGLPNYSGAVTADALTTEMLNQRRYSLWAENHRMFDLRRYDLSNTLPIDRTGDEIFNVFPIPLSENQ
ncbi:glycan metabolism protein RagB [Aquimarina atlantica]|uniref:Glycan metabolism protein RagB n=1 Tax=Aquimarina atlantica TaxID=1317122 RepID=A0A023BPB3_9FLAO|nr:RagB/SusD family nutrient uptake outer membrane protein [Aquimarina atlantica]EZH71892.1 glycan metabolism protein RagB [Aquimarina atlantica]